jgi:hypothetical protein
MDTTKPAPSDDLLVSSIHSRMHEQLLKMSSIAYGKQTSRYHLYLCILTCLYTWDILICPFEMTVKKIHGKILRDVCYLLKSIDNPNIRHFSKSVRSKP